MKPKDLREEKIVEQMKIIEKAKSEQRDLTQEENKELEGLQRDLELLEKIIAEQSEGELGGQQRSGTDATSERERSLQITELGREYKMDVESYIRNGTSVDQVRKDILEKLKENHPPVGARGNGDISVVKDEEDKFREAATDALLMRGGIELEKPAEGATDMCGISLRDLAIDTLQREGMERLNRRSDDELYGMLQRSFFNPSASFPAILDTAINKAYVEGHRTANVTFDKFTKKGSLKDFKTHDNNYLAGPAGEFLEVPEGGELKHDLPTDEKRPTRKLRTYGRQFTMTRQAFINDDIGFLSRVPAKYAKSARKTINKQVYQIMINNPVIYDGTPLFHAGHKNVLAAGTGITRESMQIMIMALQTQLDEFGEAIIIRPAVLVVPSGCMFDVYTMFNDPTVHTTANTQSVNPLYRYRESIEVVEDPTINVLSGGFGNQMPWWLIGSKEDTEFIEVDYLNGREIPVITRAEVPGQLGFVWDTYLDWGINAMDYRGAVKNNGIIIKNPLE